ncbi:GP84 [Caviid betaherpesvirus 2]|uniref:GP84 n=1 Tax=Guinea pig cytomegalovirus (strain 22122) TaxID=103920 RepID=E9RH90_GPCMV|nr:GP84 [Caviid betaherpesvirus 2]AGE11554.1 GP84 [Caviid betaherpesvirus 2]AIL83942.1 GP84 [BAC cloning vector GPN13BACdenovo_preserved(MM)]BAJ78542.1 GP84 [Caviid betaherpesvirus 2]
MIEETAEPFPYATTLVLKDTVGLERSSTHICKVIQMRHRFRQEDRSNLKIDVLRDEIQVSTTDGQSDVLRHMYDQDDVEYLLCVSADESSDAFCSMTVASLHTSHINVYLRKSASVRTTETPHVTLNLFAFPAIVPDIHRIPLRAMDPDKAARTLLPPSHADSVCVAPAKNGDERHSIEVTFRKSQPIWHPGQPEATARGPRFTTTVITATLDPATKNALMSRDRNGHYGFIKMVNRSHDSCRISKAFLSSDTLCVYVSSTAVQKYVPRELELTVSLYHAPTNLPYLSGSMTPYFIQDAMTGHLIVTAPVDIEIPFDTAYELNVQRKHYGRHLGLFVPWHRPDGLQVTVGTWHPREWLTVRLYASRCGVRLQRGDGLGKVYFVPTAVTRDRVYREPQYGSTIRSILTGFDDENLRLAGLKIPTRNLPSLLLPGKKTRAQIDDYDAMGVDYPWYENLKQGIPYIVTARFYGSDPAPKSV